MEPDLDRLRGRRDGPARALLESLRHDLCPSRVGGHGEPHSRGTARDADSQARSEAMPMDRLGRDAPASARMAGLHYPSIRRDARPPQQRWVSQQRSRRRLSPCERAEGVGSSGSRSASQHSGCDMIELCQSLSAVSTPPSATASSDKAATEAALQRSDRRRTRLTRKYSIKVLCSDSIVVEHDI